MNTLQHAQSHLVYASQSIDESVEMRAPYLLCKGFINAGWGVEFLTIAQPQNRNLSSAWGVAPITKVSGKTRAEKLLKLSLRLFCRPRRHFVVTWVWDWHGYALALARCLIGSPYAVVLDSYAHRATYHGKSLFTQLRLEARYGFVLRNADVIIAESPTAYEAARQHTNAHVILAPSSYWLSDLQAHEQNWREEECTRRPVILYTGRLVESKNIHHLVAAFAQVAAKFLEWSVEIVGPATDETYVLRIQQQVRQLGLEGRVRLLPAMTGGELHRKYKTSAIYCLPSQSEGFPSTILEAMYFGGAIIASNVGSISYQLDDGCGLLCELGDDFALTSCLTQLMNSEANRQMLMDAAKQRFLEKFTWEAHFHNILHSFETVLGTRPNMTSRFK